MSSPENRRSAAFFDLDKTVIATSSAMAFSKPFYQGGLLTRRSVLKGAYANFVFLAGAADHDQMERLRRHLSQMSTGWPVRQVQEIVAETLHELIQPHIFAEAAALIDEHHAAGRDVVVVSASGADLVEPIGALLGADHVVASRLVVDDAGCYTGEIAYYAYAEAKAEAVRDLAEREGYDLAASYAYSDSITDIPMLEAVGHPAVVNPDRSLRKEATARGWPVLTFSRPVTLRERHVPRPPHPAVTAAALGASAATAGLVWYVARRREARSGAR